MARKKISSNDCIEILKKEFGLKTQREVAKLLKLSPGRISQLTSNKVLTRRILKSILGSVYRAGNRIAKKDAYSDLNKQFLGAFGELHKLDTQVKLAKALGNSRETIAQWSSGNSKIPQQAIKKILKNAAPVVIRPLLEMEPVNSTQPSSTWYFYGSKTDRKREKIMNKITGKQGIYCYFDARGFLTYIGKAVDTPLDKEAEKRLSQKSKKGRIRVGKGMKQNPILCQGDIVKYISAYEVSPVEAIPLVEALLIRTTINQTYNHKVENLP